LHCLFAGSRERLFAQDVFAGFQRRQHQRQVVGGGNANIDHIDVRRRQHLHPVEGSPDFIHGKMLGDPIAQVSPDGGQVAAGALRVVVCDGNYACVGKLCVGFKMHPAHESHADHSDSQHALSSSVLSRVESLILKAWPFSVAQASSL
jgi:hypothetical protein